MSPTQIITMEFEVPDYIDKEKFKKEVKYKLLAEKLYKLLEGEDIGEIEEELRKRRINH
jgi:hypothetical protein